MPVGMRSFLSVAVLASLALGLPGCADNSLESRANAGEPFAEYQLGHDDRLGLEGRPADPMAALRWLAAAAAQNWCPAEIEMGDLEQWRDARIQFYAQALQGGVDMDAPLTAYCHLRAAQALLLIDVNAESKIRAAGVALDQVRALSGVQYDAPPGRVRYCAADAANCLGVCARDFQIEAAQAPGYVSTTHQQACDQQCVFGQLSCLRPAGP
jgi:hypothetical protein